MTTSRNNSIVQVVLATALMVMMVFPSVASAFVTPSSEPLFNSSNLIPGTVLSSTINIANPTSGTLTSHIGPGATNDNSDNLGDWLQMTISNSGGDLYSDTLTNFLASAPVPLTAITAGSNETYTLKLTFNDATPQGFMGTSITFDLCAGFADGLQECGIETFLPGTPDDDGGGGGGGGGSSSGGSASLASLPDGRVLGASTDTCEQLLYKYIHPTGDNDKFEVTKLQMFLRDLEGHHDLEITGLYDQATQEAVSEFQQKYSDRVLRPWGLPLPTRFVYYTTRKMVNEIYCKFTKEFPLTADQEAEIAWYKARGLSYTPGASSTTAKGNDVVAGASTSSGTSSNEGSGGKDSVNQEIGEQAAAVVAAGTSFWGKVVGFVKSLFSW